MDPLFLAITRFRQRQFPEAISHCGEILRKNPLDQVYVHTYLHTRTNVIHYILILILQAAWSLKTRALTEQVRVDFLEIFDDGIAEAVFSEDTIATTARPGTSLRTPATSGGRLPTRDGPSPAIRSDTVRNPVLSKIIPSGIHI